MRARVAILLSCVIAPLGAAHPARAGETLCWFENGAVIAPAAIADMAGDYVIDLSAPRTLLHNTKAQMAGITTETITLPVQIAGLTVPAVSVTVADLDDRGAGFAAPIVGVDRRRKAAELGRNAQSEGALTPRRRCSRL